MQPLTDEERKRLLKRLRYTAEEHWWADHCEEAADEIERLAVHLNKSQTRVRELEAEAGYVFDRNRGRTDVEET